MVADESVGVVLGTVGGLTPTVVTVVTGTVVDGTVVEGTVVVDVGVDVNGVGGGGGSVTGTVVTGTVVDGMVDGTVVDGTVVEGTVVDGIVVDGIVGGQGIVVVDGIVDGTVVGGVVVGVQHLTVVVVFHVLVVTGRVVVVHHQFQFHVLVVTPPWRGWRTTCLVTVFVVAQLVEPELLPLWLVEAFDVRAGSAMRLSVTTATTANANRALLSNRIVVARHIPTSCRKVNVWPLPRIMRTFFFILGNPIRPCESQK
jgi:hypothetical protein